VANQDARIIYCWITTLFHAGRQWSQSCICTRNLRWFCSVAVNQKNTAGYTWSIPPKSLTVKNYMRV
jgi:hypothetical protein